jgi:hypothetical protein
MAIDTDSGSVVSASVRIGSGSHGPMYVSRRRTADRSRSVATFATIRAR